MNSQVAGPLRIVVSHSAETTHNNKGSFILSPDSYKLFKSLQASHYRLQFINKYYFNSFHSKFCIRLRCFTVFLFFFFTSISRMGIRLPSVIQNAKQILKRHNNHALKSADQVVPRGHIAVYVGEMERKRFVVPISYLNHPLFADLLNRAEEEFGFNHPMGGLTIPCKEDAFIDLTSRLH